MAGLDDLVFDHWYPDDLPGEAVEGEPAAPGTERPRQVIGAAWSPVEPTPTAEPKLIAHSPEVADLLGLDADTVASDRFARVFSGNEVVDGMAAYAMNYGGHQFGNWAGQLGDGRAIALGEIATPDGGHQVLQLKGAGPTPYSRSADGRAVLRSSIREFLCSEAMHHLGVPTTRALSLTLTGDDVVRDMLYDGHPAPEHGAVVCRTAPSFVRFGHFELPASRGDLHLIRELIEHTIHRHFAHLLTDPTNDADDDGAGRTDAAWTQQPDSATDSLDAASSAMHDDASSSTEVPTTTGPTPITNEHIGRWFAEVADTTADLMVDWMRVGFVHGVMNTDNLSILGLTIDYGPYGWLEDFDPGWTPNTTDAGGRRYRYGQQPQIAMWNLARLASAIHELTNDPEPLQAVLDGYSQRFGEGWNRALAAKLGLTAADSDVATALGDELLSILPIIETDMTIFFRTLGEIDVSTLDPTLPDDELVAPLIEAYYDPSALVGDVLSRTATWLRDYVTTSATTGSSADQRRAAMHAVNPKFVLRNYLAQMAIDKAEVGEFSMIDELLDLLRNPYDDQPGRDEYATRRPDWARDRVGCSMLSCSS